MSTDYILGAPRRLLSGTVVVLICSIPAFAGSINWFGTIGVQDQYVNTAPGIGSTYHTSGLIQEPLSSLPYTVTNSGSSAYPCCVGGAQSGQLSTSSSYGSLSTSASAQAYGLDGTGAGVDIDSGVGGGAFYWGAGNGLFVDELAITSTTLANGTPINLTFDLTFAANSAAQADALDASSVTVGAYYLLGVAGNITSQSVTFGGSETDAAPGATIGPFEAAESRSVTLATQVGAVFQIEGQIYGAGTADSGDGYGGASSFSYSDSTSLSIAGITDGACLVSESGTDYGQGSICGNASAAPEPSTVTLLGTAALVLLAARRKRHWA